jgi:hypothetical protein
MVISGIIFSGIGLLLCLLFMMGPLFPILGAPLLLCGILLIVKQRSIVAE